MKDFTTGNEARLILRFATPMLLGNLFQQLYNVTDRIIVGQVIDEKALAAVGASFPILFALISFSIGIAAGATIVISQYFGAKDYNNVKKAINTLYIFFFVASIILSATGFIFSEKIFRLIKLPEEIMPHAKVYFKIISLGIIVFFGFNGTSAILRGLGDSKTPLYFLIIASLFNILLDLLFVIVLRWGVAGAAFATIIAQLGAFITAIIYLNRTHKLININFLKLKFDKAIFFQSVRIGVPAGFQQTFVAIGLIALYRVVNDFGTDVTSAFAAATTVDNLARLPAMTLGQALAAFVGQNMGASKVNRVKTGLKATLFISLIISISITFLIVSFRGIIMHFFTNNEDVIKVGIEYLVITATFYLFFSIMFTFNGVMRGAGDTLIPMFITLISLWIIRIPLAVLLSRTMGTDGIWWSAPVSWIAGTLFSFLYYLTGKWKSKVVVKKITDPQLAVNQT
jgi:putative MATE family efflux protein